MATVFKRKTDKKNRTTRWTISWFDAECQQWRQAIGYNDKESSLKKGQRLEAESAKKAEGLIDPQADHRKTAIAKHLDEYISKIEAGRRSARYVGQVRNRIERVLSATGVKRLHQLDPVAVLRAISGLRSNGKLASGRTQNEYITSLKGFTKWAVETRRVESDPLLGLKKLESRVVEAKHPRRALTPEQVRDLLVAAAERPLIELRKIRTGPNKGQLLAKVSKRAERNAIKLGEERRLCYLLAVWTGLRRSEVKMLTWSDVDLDSKPSRLQLRAEATKSRRADSVVLHPEIAEALRQHRPARASAKAPVVTTVPDMKSIRADLRHAGIDPGDETTGFVDFHALRKTLSTVMAAAGLSQRSRQAHMRHTDPRLTEGTYMDERLLPIADETGRDAGLHPRYSRFAQRHERAGRTKYARRNWPVRAGGVIAWRHDS